MYTQRKIAQRITGWSLMFGLLLAVSASQNDEAEDLTVIPLRPTIIPPKTFNVTADAEVLFNLINNTENFVETAISIFAKRTAEQRVNIFFELNRLYGNEKLFSALVPLASGDFGAAITAVLSPAPVLYSIELNDALYFDDEDAILEILLFMNNVARNETFKEYESHFDTKFINDINLFNTSEEFRQIVYVLCSDTRDERSIVNKEKVKSTAKVLKTLLESPEKTNLTILNSILLKTNAAQVRAINREYVNLTHHTIGEAVHKKLSGYAKGAYDSIVRFVMNPHRYLAEQLNEAIDDEEPDLVTINRIIIGRAEVDLGNIISHYQHRYSHLLSKDLKKVTDGKHQLLLLKFLGDFV